MCAFSYVFVCVRVYISICVREHVCVYLCAFFLCVCVSIFVPLSLLLSQYVCYIRIVGTYVRLFELCGDATLCPTNLGRVPLTPVFMTIPALRVCESWMTQECHLPEPHTHTDTCIYNLRPSCNFAHFTLTYHFTSKFTIHSAVISLLLNM